jgi:hypothetical protein
VIKSRGLKWVGHVPCIVVVRNACKISITKPEGKRALGISRHGLKNNIKN